LKNRISIIKLLTFLLSIFIIHNSSQAQVIHEVFLPNTDHELNVYRIFGEQPGKTIMIIGGIQGDEPGGYMTADLYADIHLKKGNLIVVPRANFYSILLNQREGLTGDMNRKFGARGTLTKSLDEEVVSVLKQLIAESDLLLNLHEGSGFYSPVWINDMENPQRYGQSIIYDAEIFPLPNNQGLINLGGLAQNVIKKVNSQIENKRYHFTPNNHNTISEKTSHPEQRLSATHYALTHAFIPAFGVETSKTIANLELKISLHKLVINAFMELLGIELDTPGLDLKKPELTYLLIRVNDGPSYAMPHGSTLKIKPGDEVLVTDIIANYKRGMVADINGMGNRNDTNIPFSIAKDTKITVRKDAEECGWVLLDVGIPDSPQSETVARIDPSSIKAEELIINVNDKIETLSVGETLSVKKDSRLILKGIRTNIPHLDSDVFINFKGFAPPKSGNDGNDLDYPIYTSQDLWPRFSVNKKGELYPVIATYNDIIIGEFWVELANN
jgi:Carboxypeptidase controlling helical cell shape catalytic